MKFDEVSLLLPCHSLEDFPTHAEGEQAEGLLAAWSSLWHPALLAHTGRMPTWHRADSPPETLAGRLIVIPPNCEPLLLAGWASRATAEGAHVVRKLHKRAEIIAAALAGLDEQPAVDPELVADFLALGFGYLSVELLTRQMRYMSNIDEVHMQNETLAAARACVAGDAEATRRHLKNAFDVLVEARERFYPVDAYLIDLTLVAPTTIGEGLRRQLQQEAPQNLLLSGETLARIAEGAPETLAALRLALDHKTISLVGGDERELELPLLPIEEVLADLRAGAQTFKSLVGEPPHIYGRRRFGLSPVLPQILSRLGFIGAVHCTLDDGRFATATQSKTRWEGLDHSAIEALARLPLDAAKSEIFLGLPRAVGESMDRDHVATIMLAHWPGQVSEFYRDLWRMAAYGPVLGKFVTLEDYFAHTTSAGELTKFKADGYRSPYLRQAVARREPQPISQTADEHARDARRVAAESLETLAELLKAPAVAPTTGPPATLAGATARQERAAARLSSVLALGATGLPNGAQLLNPLCFARRVVVDVSSIASLPAVGGAIVAAQESAGRKLIVADAPGMGFCHVRPAQVAPPKKKTRPIAAEHTLANEFLRVEISPTSGGLHSIHDSSQRGNRLSSQLALRKPPPRPKPGDLWRDPEEGAEYSNMVADSLEIAQNGPAVGEIVTRGRLVDAEGHALAGFVQRYQLAAGSRVITIEAELEIDHEPKGDPWESYYAARFAWSDEAAELFRAVSMAIIPTDARQLESPHLVELRTARTRTAILTGGLPYHRRSGTRMLDTLLAPPGETRRRFRYAIGVELRHPMEQALDLLNPIVATPAALPEKGPEAAWMFRIDARNCIATHWSVIRDGGRVAGFRARILETEGVATRVKLSALFELKEARQVDFLGQTLAELPVNRDDVTIDIAPFEWVEIEARLRA
ncbi:MAG TPA: hypothetical protein VGJ26_07190 [Pirellulales bacterium]